MRKTNAKLRKLIDPCDCKLVDDESSTCRPMKSVDGFYVTDKDENRLWYCHRHKEIRKEIKHDGMV